MIVRCLTASFALLALVASPPAQAHELWFPPAPGSDRTLTRLYFGDSPAPGEAERVAEIAHTKVWMDGKPVDVQRLPDGLEVRLPAHRPELISAYADRGIVDFQGDSFIITLAAYAQSPGLMTSSSASMTTNSGFCSSPTATGHRWCERPGRVSRSLMRPSRCFGARRSSPKSGPTATARSPAPT